MCKGACAKAGSVMLWNAASSVTLLSQGISGKWRNSSQNNGMEHATPGGASRKAELSRCSVCTCVLAERFGKASVCADPSFRSFSGELSEFSVTWAKASLWQLIALATIWLANLPANP